jgi:uncharacterized protein (TIGR03083 family)
MTTMTAAPRRLDRDTARAVAGRAYDDLIALLETLDPADWSAPTDCTAWDVAAMVGHLIGAAESHVAMRELVRQYRQGWRRRRDFGGSPLDAVNDLQVREHADLTPEERVAALRRLAPRAVDKRMSLPGLARRVRLPNPPAGDMPAGTPRSFTLGHLEEVVLTRDVFIHRIDIARATQRPLPLTAETDGRIVEDIVAEWFDRLEEDLEVRLTGPAGGRWRRGSGGPLVEMDAIEFCRALSGRAEASGPLRTRVLF